MHRVGDAVLTALAERLAGTVRDEDVVARIGGDEFLIMLVDIRGAAQAQELAERILRVVSAPIRVDDREFRTTMSIGVVLPSPHEDVDAAVSRADQAMYQAKTEGGDRVVSA